MFRKSTEKINNTIDFTSEDYKVILFFFESYSANILHCFLYVMPHFSLIKSVFSSDFAVK